MTSAQQLIYNAVGCPPIEGAKGKLLKPEPGVCAITGEYQEITADALLDLLGDVTHLGARHRNGFGHVQKWEVTPPVMPNFYWHDYRPMPVPDGPVLRRPRAPYHHPSGRVPHDR